MTSDYQAAIELAQAGLCSHGGHGWDGDACDEIPAPAEPRCGYRLAGEPDPCSMPIEFVSEWRHVYRAADRYHAAVHQ